MPLRSFLVVLFFCSNVFANSLPSTLEKIRPSIVAIGASHPLAKPHTRILGTGFVVGDGTLIATNEHVINQEALTSGKRALKIFFGRGSKAQSRSAQVIAVDKLYDLAIIRLSGTPLKPLRLSNQTIKEGENFAFTGFPIVNALGLYPVTHQAIISSISPIAVAARSSKELTPAIIKALKNPYDIYLLDAVAYPGNSGSPVYNVKTGEVIAMINKVLARKTRESVVSHPTGITYATSIKPLKFLLQKYSS